MDQSLSSARSRAKIHAAKPRALNPMHITLLVLGILGVILLAYGAHTTPYYDFDLAIVRGVQAIHNFWYDAFLRAVSYFGYPPQVYGWVFAALAFLWFSGRRWEAVTFIFVSFGIGIIGLVIKYPVDRMRPSPDLIYVANPQLDGGKFSFPAGHVQVFVACLGYFMYLILQAWKRAWYQILFMLLFSGIIIFIGASRIYMGEHWFSDVIGAYLIGVLWLWVSLRFYEWGKPRFFVPHKPAAHTE